MKTEHIAEQVHEKFSQAQEGVSHLVDQAKPLAKDAAKKSKELYNEAREHLPENAENWIAVAVGGLAVVLIAYRLGKKKQKKESVITRATEASAEIKKNLEPVANDFITPAFKFIKLWMFYRLSQ